MIKIYRRLTGFGLWVSAGFSGAGWLSLVRSAIIAFYRGAKMKVNADYKVNPSMPIHSWWLHCGNHRKFQVSARLPEQALFFFDRASKESPLSTDGFSAEDVTTISPVA